MKTDLLGHIQARRSERRRKSPFRPTLYTHVAGLVRRYGLDETFLRALDSPQGPHGPLRIDVPAGLRLKRKEALEPHLFSLSTEAEHRVTLGILERVKVPYLPYATSPDEILACRGLFERNPSLSAETLEGRHFEMLLFEDRLKAHVGDLTEQGRAILGCEEERR